MPGPAGPAGTSCHSARRRRPASPDARAWRRWCWRRSGRGRVPAANIDERTAVDHHLLQLHRQARAAQAEAERCGHAATAAALAGIAAMIASFEDRGLDPRTPADGEAAGR